MNNRPKLTSQEAYEAQATATMLTMAAVIHALEQAGALRPGVVPALLKARPPHHPNKAAEALARQMTQALAQSLLLSAEGGQA